MSGGVVVTRTGEKGAITAAEVTFPSTAQPSNRGWQPVRQRRRVYPHIGRTSEQKSSSLCARLDSELLVNVVEVLADGAFGNPQLLRDFGV
jgi:hypothetical protein